MTLALCARPSSLSAQEAPPVRRELRAAWVATVGNIDWPSRPDLDTWSQQAELLAILNKAVQLHLNAIIFQIRPVTDALYESRLEPWSEYLTGRQGRPPEPAGRFLKPPRRKALGAIDSIPCTPCAKPRAGRAILAASDLL